MYELDLKDKKILAALDFEARQPYSMIGKKVRLSKQVVEYRINNMIKNHIITGFYPVINIPKLGYFYCRLAITLQNISPDEIQLMYADLKKNERIFWIFEVQGSFDVFFGLWCKTLSEFRLFVDNFMEKYSRYVKQKVENIATDVIHYQHRYLLRTKHTEEVHIKETAERISIDNLDKKILSLLCENARISLVDIGLKLHEHPKTISYRISRMEKNRLIECYRVGIDHNPLGYTYYKIYLSVQNYTKNDLMRLKEYIKNNVATIYIIEGINLNSDLDFEMMIKDNSELFDFIRNLRKEFPNIVGNYSSLIFMDTLKVRYLPF